MRGMPSCTGSESSWRAAAGSWSWRTCRPTGGHLCRPAVGLHQDKDEGHLSQAGLNIKHRYNETNNSIVFQVNIWYRVRRIFYSIL